MDSYGIYVRVNIYVCMFDAFNFLLSSSVFVIVATATAAVAVAVAVVDQYSWMEALQN